MASVKQKCVKPLGAKYLSSVFRKYMVYSQHPAPAGGALRVVTNVGEGCDGRVWPRLTSDGPDGRPSRVVLIPRRWDQARGRTHGRRRLSSPVLRGDHEAAVKTIVQGMPDRSGLPVVTNSYAFYTCIRGCGCGLAPGIPCALPQPGEGNRLAKLGCLRAARCDLLS
jgi:hypothetical protein